MVQNPAFIFLNYFGPETYEGKEYTTYVTGGALLFTILVTFASLAKLVSIQFLTGVDSFLKGDVFQNVLMTELKLLFLQSLPEFIYYVIPALGTSAYLMTIDI